MTEQATEDKKKETEKKKPELIAKDIATKDFGHRMVESLGSEFMVYNSGTISFLPSITEGEMLYIPRQQKPYIPYTKPQKLTLPDIKELYSKIYAVVDDFLDIPDDYKHLLTVSIFFTYIQEKSRTTPYLYALGEKGSGKSRVLEIIELLGYRPMMATSISGPNVIQYLEDGPLTILDDEVKESIENDPDKKTIYLAGYRNTAKVPKIITDRNGIRSQVFFNAFSFKAFSSRDLCLALLERSIIIPMVKGKPKYGGFTTDGTDDTRCQNLREGLLLWRMYNHEKQLSQERPKGRLDELYFPLLKTAELIDNNEAKQAIQRIRDKEEIATLEEMRSKLEARILIAIVRINNARGEAKKNPLMMPFSEIWTTLCKVLNGTIKEGRIECSYGEITENKVGRRLKDIFKGVRQQIDFEGQYQTVYTFDKDILTKTIDLYGIQAEECKP